MKTTLKILFACLSCILAACTLNAEPWIRLFNGKDLSGWKVKCKAKDADKKFWSVEDGAILCDSTGQKDHDYVWLESEREFSDFELNFKFKAYKEFSGNSGIQFRSRYNQNIKNGGWMNGPQADIHPGKNSNWRTGLIYDETLGMQRWVFPSLPDSGIGKEHKPETFIFKYSDEEDGWNEMTLICRGMDIKIIVNGIVRTDWNAEGVLDSANHAKYNVGRSGHLAFQLHSSDQTKIRFKDIRIKDFASK